MKNKILILTMGILSIFWNCKDVKKEEQKVSRENYLKNAVAEMIYANRDNSDSSNYILAEKILRFLKVIKYIL